jgi:hypothetical protein
MSSKFAHVSIVAVALALVLGACTTGAAGTASPAPTTNVALGTVPPTTAPTATPAATATESSSAAGPSPTPGSIDPCALLTADEASALMGTKLGAGVSTELDPDRVCTFKSGLSEVKVILAPPAPDSATANAYWDAQRADVPADIPITDLTLFDRSAYGNGSTAGAPVSALFVIKGQYFFDLYCGFPACTQDASITAAQLIAGRLP